MLDVAISLTATWGDDEAAWEQRCARAVAAAVRQTPYLGLGDGPGIAEVAVRLADDAEVQALNAQWRGKDKPTNVLSFPQADADTLLIGAMADDGELLLGDIVLARETCEREASEKGIAVEAHAIHLVVHGALHLLGYDHIDEAEAEAMEEMERRAMAELGHADPYALHGDD